MSGRAGWGRRLRAGAWVAAAACVLLFARGLSWRGVLAAIGQANGSLLALAGVLALGALVVQGLRWHQVVQPVQRVPLRTVLAASLAGQAASCVLPLRAGEAVRLELLARASGMGRAAALGTVATDHTVNGSVMLLLAALSPLLLPVPERVRIAIWAAFGAVGLLGGFLLRLAGPRDSLPAGRIARALARLREGLQALRKPRALLGAAGASLTAWILEVAAAMTALSAFGMRHGLACGAAVIFGVNLALAAPAAPANLGTFELGAAMALMALGEPAESAAAFALGYHALLLVPILLFGGAGLLALRRRPTEPIEPRPALTPERAAA